MRRLLRIWPLYFTFLAAAIWLVPFLLTENFPGFHQAAFFVFLANWAIAIDDQMNSAATILWSVSIEEQFYFLWPLILYFFHRRVKEIAVALLGVAFLMRIILVLAGAPWYAIWHNTLARLDPIACGVLISVFLSGRELPLSRIIRWIGIIAGVLLLWYTGGSLYFAGKSALLSYPLASVGASLILLCTLRSGAAPNRPLVYLGRISYGLYVFHSFAVRFSGEYVHVSNPVVEWFLQFVVASCLTLLLAMVSYRFLEEPFLRLKRRFTYVLSTPPSDDASAPGLKVSPAIG